jgi:hypothetical protein
MCVRILVFAASAKRRGSSKPRARARASSYCCIPSVRILLYYISSVGLLLVHMCPHAAILCYERAAAHSSDDSIFPRCRHRLCAPAAGSAPPRTHAPRFHLLLHIVFDLLQPEHLEHLEGASEWPAHSRPVLEQACICVCTHTHTRTHARTHTHKKIVSAQWRCVGAGRWKHTSCPHTALAGRALMEP